MELKDAASILQCCFRERRRARIMSVLAYNFGDSDPISMEVLSELPSRQVALLTCPVTGRIFACDALAWATYFAKTPTRKHPCSRAPMRAEDVWACYLQAFDLLEDDVKATFRSFSLTAVRGVAEDASTVSICPMSPLFDLIMYELSSSAPVGTRKTWSFLYSLSDSRDSRQVTHRLRVTMDLGVDECVLVQPV